MRLFKKKKIYYIELKKGKKISLRTEDKAIADQLFFEFKKKQVFESLNKLKPAPTISEFVKSYNLHPDRQLLSKYTHKTDKVAFNAFSKVTGNIPIDKITNDCIIDFKLKCQKKKLSSYSINTYLKHIKSALNFATENGIIKKTCKIKLLKIKTEKIRVIKKVDLDKIINYSKKHRPEMHRIIIFALYTGCRRQEIINTRYEHINDKSILIYGKGEKTRLVPIVPKLNDILQVKANGKIFSYNGASTITNYFKIITTACGIKARFHDIRHTSATQMISNNIPLEIVQKILGHSDIKTTQIYAKIKDDVLQRHMQKLDFK